MKACASLVSAGRAAGMRRLGCSSWPGLGNSWGPMSSTTGSGASTCGSEPWRESTASCAPAQRSSHACGSESASSSPRGSALCSHHAPPIPRSSTSTTARPRPRRRRRLRGRGAYGMSSNRHVVSGTWRPAASIRTHSGTRPVGERGRSSGGMVTVPLCVTAAEVWEAVPGSRAAGGRGAHHRILATVTMARIRVEGEVQNPRTQHRTSPQ